MMGVGVGEECTQTWASVERVHFFQDMSVYKLLKNCAHEVIS
jgi:hypothetical protein